MARGSCYGTVRLRGERSNPRRDDKILEVRTDLNTLIRLLRRRDIFADLNRVSHLT